MKIKHLIIIISLLLPLSWLSKAEELTAEKTERIDILLDKTGATKVSQLIANQFIRLANSKIRQNNPDIDPKVFTIVTEEVNDEIAAEINEKNAVKEMLYPIYHKHLTLTDINEIIAFYETPLGKKFLAIMPKVSNEGMIAARDWARTLAPRIQHRLEARFLQEGIQFKK